MPDLFENHEDKEQKYGTIWQPEGFKSSIEVLLIQDWDKVSEIIRPKLNGFFEDTWKSVNKKTEEMPATQKLLL
jgi:hypothetical protein